MFQSKHPKLMVSLENLGRGNDQGWAIKHSTSCASACSHGAQPGACGGRFPKQGKIFLSSPGTSHYIQQESLKWVQICLDHFAYPAVALGWVSRCKESCKCVEPSAGTWTHSDNTTWDRWERFCALVSTNSRLAGVISVDPPARPPELDSPWFLGHSYPSPASPVTTHQQLPWLSEQKSPLRRLLLNSLMSSLDIRCDERRWHLQGNIVWGVGTGC